MASANSKFDSIFATNLPPMLRQDLKQTLLAHFANFGTILRISCATYQGEVRGHLQFSTDEEARRAQHHGMNLRGHTMRVSLTSKHPTTQILTTIPPAALSVPASVFQNEPSQSSRTMTKSISSYFASTTPGSLPLPVGGHTGKEIKPSQTSKVTVTNVASPAPCSSSTGSEDAARPTIMHSNSMSPSQKEQKPNTCTKVEVYTGLPKSAQTGQCNGLVQNSASTSETRLPFGQVQYQFPLTVPTTRPPVRTRSLSEILNLDTSKMKVVDAVTPSDALACQYFAGGSHPFSLSLMFGRMPGSVIFPVKSLMDAIKPGMEITDSTLQAAWYSILNSVTKPIIKICAQNSIAQEKAFRNIVPAWYKEFEERTLNEILTSAAEDEITAEENIMLECEDAVSHIVNLVCDSLVEYSCKLEHNLAKMVEETAGSSYLKMEENIVAKCVGASALHEILTEHCNEAIDELFSSDFCEGCVKVIAKDSLRKCKEEVKARKRQVVAALLNKECEIAIEDLFESDFMEGCVRILARNYLQRFKNEASRRNSKISTLGSKALVGPELQLVGRIERVESWIEDLHPTPLPLSQSLENDDEDDDSSDGSAGDSPYVYNQMYQPAAACQYQQISRLPAVPDEQASSSKSNKKSPPRCSFLQPNEPRGIFVSLKRKAVSFYNSLTSFKRARRDGDVS